MPDTKKSSTHAEDNTPAAISDPTPDVSVPVPVPAVDVQAAVAQALAEQGSQHAEQLKKATGFSSIKELDEARLAEQGKTQELLDSKAQELADITKRFHSSQINAALLSAAAVDAVDAETVCDLLAAKSECDDNGVVTIDGKSPADAVAELLKNKPFLAKASGDAGSGAPIAAEGKQSLSRVAFDALDATKKAEFIRDGGTVI